MFFRQLCCLFLIFMFALATKKFNTALTLRDWKYCILVGIIYSIKLTGFIGISIAQYFQLENFKTLLYQSGVYRLATWQVNLLFKYSLANCTSNCDFDLFDFETRKTFKSKIFCNDYGFLFPIFSHYCQNILG